VFLHIACVLYLFEHFSDRLIVYCTFTHCFAFFFFLHKTNI